MSQSNKIIKNMLKECDHLIVGGGIANTFLKAINYEIGINVYSYVEKVKNNEWFLFDQQ